MSTNDELYEMRRAAYLRDVKQALEFDFVKEMEIVAPEDSKTCEYCRSLDGKKYPKDAVPELPHLPRTGCTCPIGCRCVAVAVVPDTI